VNLPVCNKSACVYNVQMSLQDRTIFNVLNKISQALLIFCFIIAVIQTYIIKTGSITVFGRTFSQFYPHIELRILPLIWVSFFLISSSQKVLQVEGNFYLSKFIISILLVIDSVTQITTFYSSNYYIPFYGRVWFDKIMHFNEGWALLAVVTPLIYRYLLRAKDTIFRDTLSWSLWLTTGFVSVFFIAWEVVELFIDRAFSKHLLVTSWYDTNEDLFFAYAGILLGVIGFKLYYSFGKKRVIL
jgi:hypothetical protein